MTIRKEATNITVKVKREYASVSEKLIKVADWLNIEATRDNLVLISNKKICAKGMERYQNNPPAQNQPMLLIVEEIQGTEEVVIEEKYTYYATGFNRLATKKEKKNINWAIEVDNDAIIQLNEKGEKIKIEIKDEWKGCSLRIMAYTTDMEDEAYLDIETIKYFKKHPQIGGLITQPQSYCVPTIMSYINIEMKGGKTTYNDYFNYYWKQFNIDPIQFYLQNEGINGNHITQLIDACFEVDTNFTNIIESINSGYPIIIGTAVKYDAAANAIDGHCQAIIGYASDRKYLIIDPEYEAVRKVYLHEILNIVSSFLYLKPVKRTKGIPR